jgi:hypothetical protein
VPMNFEKKLLFVHIPKTAGTSITKFLDLRELIGPMTIFVNLPSGGLGQVPMWKQHLATPQIRKFYLDEKPQGMRRAETIKKFDEYYKFTFVRNPWDRIVSNFLYFKDEGLIPSDFSLRDFFAYLVSEMAKLVARRAPKEFNPKNRLEALLAIHCQPQHYYLSKVDPVHVFRFENLIPDMQFICDHLQIHFDKNNFPHEKNNNNKEHYTSFYGDDLKLIADVGRLYENDVKLFGYKFGE